MSVFVFVLVNQWIVCESSARVHVCTCVWIFMNELWLAATVGLHVRSHQNQTQVRIAASCCSRCRVWVWVECIERSSDRQLNSSPDRAAVINTAPAAHGQNAAAIATGAPAAEESALWTTSSDWGAGDAAGDRDDVGDGDAARRYVHFAAVCDKFDRGEEQ